ncbi:hypothetical protein CR161_09940 [Prosthecochloris sp. ZM]|uniref:LOG family protein n=1 Tax=Prosthecochloris sp. ZM TaxID=2283143 RepID=UPI000DF74A0F|nr:LOG family protein [Prosthecochloris sp. ZM]RDD30991.1 hypothetical protein CR161_09940 [Prosthecochloris sp. ZM]
MEPHYKVAIFGSARIREGDRIYQDVFQIARGLAQSGIDVITGGGPGLMLAANAGSKSANSGTHSIGLNIRLPHEQHSNEYLDIKQEFDRFSSRLDTFMSLADAVVVAPGGIGTLLELFYAWQLVQVEHICETPIILFGDQWEQLLRWMHDAVLGRELMDSKDMRMIFHIRKPEQVVAMIRTMYSDRLTMEHICNNFQKYRVDFSLSGPESGGR